jgi:uncharacterized membrane protein YfcA
VHTFIKVIALIVIFFLTSVVGVVTGSNSLITVPAMLSFGIEPRTALATNMFALTFLSFGGTLPFLGTGTFDRRRLPLLVFLTLVGSVLGALFVLITPSKAMPLLISIFILAVAAFSFLKRDAGVIQKVSPPSQAAELSGYAATFLLGIYGGFFSGGYVTILTPIFVVCFSMTFVQAVANTKLVNIFSSLVATLIFIWCSIVDYRLGLILAVTAFIGAIIGARIALKLDNLWLRRIFLATVAALALKTLIYDFVLQQLL